MLTTQRFFDVLKGISELLPRSKPLSEQALLLAWSTFPEQAKQELTDRDLAWAAGQLMQDPDRNTEEPPHLALLRYLYRCGDGRPRLDWGLRHPDGTPGSRPQLPPQPPASNVRRFPA